MEVPLESFNPAAAVCGCQRAPANPTT